MEELVFYEEIARHRAPGYTNIHGMGWVGPILIRYGAEEQRQRFVPKILNGDEWWCTLYSEPDAGSDMAAVKTHAIENGDHFVINGQKVWNSHAHCADWAVILARTDLDAPKHRGLSYLIVDMKSPGITVRPLRNMTGCTEFNETFLDNVRVPKHQLIGEKNQGWYIAAGALEFERTSMLGTAIARVNTVKDLMDLARHCGKSLDPVIRQKVAQLFIEANVSRYMGLRGLSKQLRTGRPGPEGAMSSLLEMELNQRIHDLAMQIEGPYSRLVRGSGNAVENGRWQYGFLRSRGNTIETGTSEIKRNVVAQRVLNLPR